MKLLEALRLLNPEEDDHWTSDGAPRMSFIHALMESDEVTRKDVIDLAPDLDRESMKTPENLLMNRGENLEGRLQEAQESLKKKEEEVARLRREVKERQLEIKAQEPVVSEADEIQSFLASERKERQRLYDRRHRLLGDVTPAELDPRAPIDAAMARKRNRGAQRPQRS